MFYKVETLFTTENEVTKMLTKDDRSKAQHSKDDFDALFEKSTTKNTLLNNYLRKLKKSYRRLFYDVFYGKKSYSKAVKAKCLDCSCFERVEITHCEVKTCPLYKIRPYQVKK